MNKPTVKFACPIHKTALTFELHCPLCNKDYPRVNGIPVLINDEDSVFNTADYLNPEDAYGGASSYAGHLDNRKGIRQLYRKLMHHISESNPAPRDFDADSAVSEINKRNQNARILVIGSGDKPYIGNCTYTDVAFGKHVTCIADAHDLPFEDESFDACVACAVLEHVADPQRCVSEIHRVLKPSGYVFSETPFMQPVHMGAYDFTRFTYLGHRRLFRFFDEIRSGIAAGPATSTAQLLRYLFSSLTDRQQLKKWLKMIGLIASYPVRYLDKLTSNKQSAYDAASGFYFFGTKRDSPIKDREILKYFKGG